MQRIMGNLTLTLISSDAPSQSKARLGVESVQKKCANIVFGKAGAMRWCCWLFSDPPPQSQESGFWVASLPRCLPVIGLTAAFQRRGHGQRTQTQNTTSSQGFSSYC